MSKVIQLAAVKMAELADIASNISVVRERIATACAKRTPVKINK